MLQKKTIGDEKVEKLKDESRKLFAKVNDKKQIAKLDKLTKTYGNTSQTKKSQSKFNKETLFKQPKLFTKSIKSTKKEQKSIEIDFPLYNQSSAMLGSLSFLWVQKLQLVST